jgi:hypothetical protein
MTDIPTIAAGLTKAQRTIMLGHQIDIPPEEADQLEELDLKQPAYFHETHDTRRMVWPITPLGLAVREYLQEQER